MKSTNLENAPKFNPIDGAMMALVGDGERMTLVRITAQPGAVFADHSHDHEQIGTCFEGGGVLSSGGKDLVMKPGDSWVVPPNEVHKFVTGNETTIIYESWCPPREDYQKLAKII
jgi:quercetin dioxygenase-like cupin family protein